MTRKLKLIGTYYSLLGNRPSLGQSRFKNFQCGEPPNTAKITQEYKKKETVKKKTSIPR